MMHIYKLLLLIYTLSTLTFFQPLNMVPQQLNKGISFASLFLVLIFPYFMSNKRMCVTQQFRNPMLLIVLLIAISILMPFFSSYEQSVGLTFMVTIPFFTYAIYFSLHRSGIEEDFIYKLVFFIAIVGMLTNLINRLAFPMIVFGEEKEEYDFDRGGLRLACIGFFYVVFTFFVAIDKFKKSKKIGWLIYVCIAYLFVILSFTRQYIILCSVFGVLMYYKGQKWHKQFIIALAVSIFAIYLLPKISFVEKMIEVTEQEQLSNEMHDVENIRIRAFKNFLYEDYDNVAQHLLGHGIPSYTRSAWGNQRLIIHENTRFVQADVGWAGFSWYFGLVATFFLLKLFIMVFMKTKWETAIFFFCWLFVASFASAGILHSYEIIVWVFALYLTDCKKQNEINNTTIY